MRFSVILFLLLFSLPCLAEISSSSVPNQVVQALASSDILLALQHYSEEPQGKKNQQLFHEMLHAVEDNVHAKNKQARPDLYYNLKRRGIAYHNIYLFLRTQGINEKDYLKKARNFYQQAIKLGSEIERAKCQVLLATLFSLDGDEKKAEKQMGLVNPQLLSADAEMVSYVASYWAAREDIEQTLLALEYAHILAPKPILAWAEEGDDFWLVSGDVQFQDLLRSWQEKNSKQEHALSLPRKNTLMFDLPELEAQPRFSEAHRAKKKSKVFKKLYPNR